MILLEQKGSRDGALWRENLGPHTADTLGYVELNLKIEHPFKVQRPHIDFLLSELQKRPTAACKVRAMHK